jgi:hypothetical protein
MLPTNLFLQWSAGLLTRCNVTMHLCNHRALMYLVDQVLWQHCSASQLCCNTGKPYTASTATWKQCHPGRRHPQRAQHSFEQGNHVQHAQPILQWQQMLLATWPQLQGPLYGTRTHPPPDMFNVPCSGSSLNSLCNGRHTSRPPAACMEENIWSSCCIFAVNSGIFYGSASSGHPCGTLDTSCAP